MASNSPAPTNMEVLWQEMEHQKKLTTDLSSQIQRVRRFARVDELEAVTGKLEKDGILIQTVTELSKGVHALVDARQRELSVGMSWSELSQHRTRSGESGKLPATCHATAICPPSSR